MIISVGRHLVLVSVALVISDLEQTRQYEAKKRVSFCCFFFGSGEGLSLSRLTLAMVSSASLCASAGANRDMLWGCLTMLDSQSMDAPSQ